ncbi:hypothetical protein BDQ17DRAFT_1330617 [Cyathus striatus]|nr:hypothetical protein BDQ17DRAFT_1330617 [Cyathus striatus]
MPACLQHISVSESELQLCLNQPSPSLSQALHIQEGLVLAQGAHCHQISMSLVKTYPWPQLPLHCLQSPPAAPSNTSTSTPVDTTTSTTPTQDTSSTAPSTSTTSINMSTNTNTDTNSNTNMITNTNTDTSTALPGGAPSGMSTGGLSTAVPPSVNNTSAASQSTSNISSAAQTRKSLRQDKTQGGITWGWLTWTVRSYAFWHGFYFCSVEAALMQCDVLEPLPCLPVVDGDFILCNGTIVP